MPLPEVQARMPGRAVAVLASVHVSGGKVKLCGLGSISALGCFGPETPGGRACSRTCLLITRGEMTVPSLAESAGGQLQCACEAWGRKLSFHRGVPSCAWGQSEFANSYKHLRFQ